MIRYTSWLDRVGDILFLVSLFLIGFGLITGRGYLAVIGAITLMVLIGWTVMKMSARRRSAKENRS